MRDIMDSLLGLRRLWDAPPRDRVPPPPLDSEPELCPSLSAIHLMNMCMPMIVPWRWQASAWPSRLQAITWF